MHFDDMIEFSSPLGKAIALWSQGKRISVSLAAMLMQEGYDVPALERRHLKRT